MVCNASKLDYSNKGGSLLAEVGYVSARVVVYSQVGRGKAAEKPELTLR